MGDGERIVMEVAVRGRSSPPVLLRYDEEEDVLVRESK